MRKFKLTATRLRATGLIAAIGIALGASIEIAAAQSRLFSCPHARVLDVTITGPDTISAGPIEGKTLQMKKDPSNAFHFYWGDYAVKFAPDGSEATLEIPDFGSTKCIYGHGGAAPALPQPAPQRNANNGNPCGPGFHPVPETDRCDPNPGTNPNAQPRRTGSAEGQFPMGGQSLGGIVRAEPSLSSARVSSLAEGTAITLMARAGTMDGYDWFVIQFRGQTGYQWGGIMCSDAPIRGILQQCQP